MKVLVVIMFLMFPVVATAQNQGMNGNDLQQMMQLMQKMQQCMANVDQAKLKELEQESKKMSEELQTLCKNGKRKKAQKTAVAYGKKMLKNPALKQLEKCGEMTKGLIPEDAAPSLEDEFDFSDRHVCDDLP